MGKKKTNEEWVKICKEIHGDSVDYSQTDFNDRDEKGRVKFICPIHGEFKQNLMNHVYLKHGCSKCNGGIKHTNEEFIQKSKDMYGDDTWIYDKVEYINENTEVILICREHGEFKVKPVQHLNKYLMVACPYCKGKVNIEKIFKELKEKYDDNIHTIVSYRQDNKKRYKYFIKVHCNFHGDFEIRLDHLLNRKVGICGKCNIINSKFNLMADNAFYNEITKRVSNEKYNFIWNAIQIYGYDKYYYDSVEIIDRNTEVKIFCNNHKGYFYVTPFKFLHKRLGCKRCAKFKRYKDTEEWIKFNVSDELLKKYDFSKTIYVNKETKMELICPIHGSFWRYPSAIRSGNIVCDKCAQTILETNINDLLINNNINFIFQCTHKNLSFLNRQSYDFYLTDYNIAIECQGRQHFEPTNFGQANNELVLKEFELCQERDLKKKKLSIENNVTLVYYLDKKFEKYLNSDEDIYFTDKEELLKFILSKPKIIKEDLNNEASNKT